MILVQVAAQGSTAGTGRCVTVGFYAQNQTLLGLGVRLNINTG
jgi:hypothetical protein